MANLPNGTKMLISPITFFSINSYEFETLHSKQNSVKKEHMLDFNLLERHGMFGNVYFRVTFHLRCFLGVAFWG